MSRKLKTIIFSLIIVGFLIGVVYFFLNEDGKTSLTVSQRKWIEKNKNNVIDLSVLSGVPVINDNGNGMFLEFLNTLESETGLDFNKLSYNKGGKPSSDYALVVGESSENGILFYKDNYVIVTKGSYHYNDVTELKDLNIGYTSGTKDLDKYLYGNQGCIFTAFDDEASMFDGLEKEVVDGVVVPKLDYMQYILENGLNIAYNIDEYSIDYVLKLGSNVRLNKILTKYFENYKETKYDGSFAKFLSDVYFTSKGIDEKAQASFRSKRYSYGFVLDEPYMININSKLNGFNYSFIKSFSKAANVEIDFKRYSSIKNVMIDFNKGSLDIIYGDTDSSKYDISAFQTVPVYNNKASLITKGNTELTINNVSSLKDITVLVVENSSSYKYLKKNGIKTKTFDNTKSLIDKLSNDDVALVDSYVYDYFVRSSLKDSIKLKTIDILNDFGFITKNTRDNKIFNEFLNFYITFVSSNRIINQSYLDIFSSNDSIIHLQAVLAILVIILIFLVLILAVSLLKKRGKRKVKLSKNDKLRYVDSMTSLKNRDYLNDNVYKWDESEIYPQSVVIVDLNNIAYINDNFGHAEGDKVIIEAAGILIKHQLSDSELVRTNGNEFLVFTIGHEEKDIVTYIRKLNKEFKELSHGFGAAIGYSMINDEIKTIDDAINEATIDMRDNKEDIK